MPLWQSVCHFWSTCRSEVSGYDVFDQSFDDLKDDLKDMPEIRLWVVRADILRAKKYLYSFNTFTAQDFALQNAVTPYELRLVQEIGDRLPAGKAVVDSKYFGIFDTFASNRDQGWNEILKGLIDLDDRERVIDNLVDKLFDKMWFNPLT